MATRLLAQGMMAGMGPAKIDETVQKLASRDVYFDHGSVIDCEEAKSLHLSVEYLKPSNDLWQRLWLLHCMYAYDCKKSDYLKVFEGRARSTAVATAPKP
jgi:hypothetical protein